MTIELGTLIVTLVAVLANLVISYRRLRYERKSSIANAKYDLLINMVNKIDSSSTITNKAMNSIYEKKDRNESDINDEIKLYVNAVNDVKLARTYAIILGSKKYPKISELLKQRFSNYESVKIHLEQYGIGFQQEFIDDMFEERQLIGEQLEEYYEYATKEIYA